MIYAQLRTIDIDIDSTILRTVMHPQVVARFLLIRAPLTITDPQIKSSANTACANLLIEVMSERKTKGKC